MPYFPENTIHLFAIKFLNPSETIESLSIDNTRYLITKYKQQYIVCPDNGLFTLIDKEFNEPVYQIILKNEKQHSFYLRDIFTDIADKLLNTIPLEEFAVETKTFGKLYNFEKFFNTKQPAGHGIV